MREDGSLMGQAPVQADALQEMGIKSRSQSPAMTGLDEPLIHSLVHLSRKHNQSTYYAHGAMPGAVGSACERAQLTRWCAGMLTRGGTADPEEATGIRWAEKRSE